MKLPEIGSPIFLRYRDAVLFKDASASQFQPWVRECIGWLDYEDEEYIRVVWERYSEPNLSENATLRSTGLVIPRSNILEMRRLGR